MLTNAIYTAAVLDAHFNMFRPTWLVLEKRYRPKWNGKMSVKLPIVILIYTISKFKHHWNSEWISFPMMYHTVLYILYSPCASQFNNMPNFGNYGNTHFPPKWFSWQPKSCDLSPKSLLTRMPNMVKIWFELTKLQLQIALFNIFCKKVILPFTYLCRKGLHISIARPEKLRVPMTACKSGSLTVFWCWREKRGDMVLSHVSPRKGYGLDPCINIQTVICC